MSSCYTFGVYEYNNNNNNNNNNNYYYYYYYYYLYLYFVKGTNLGIFFYLFFYIRGSVHRNSRLKNSNEMQQYADIYLRH